MVAVFLRSTVPGIADDVARFIVTILIVLGGFAMMAIRPDSSNAILPVMTLTVGHFYGRTTKRTEENEHE